MCCGQRLLLLSLLICVRRLAILFAFAGRQVYLCAVVDGYIVGTANVDSIGANKVKHRAELGVAIDKAFCGVGIGRALITACIECAKEAGYSQLELEVVRENSNAIALYKSMGFIEFGRNPRGFRSRYQGWQELLSMRLELDWQIPLYRAAPETELLAFFVLTASIMPSLFIAIRFCVLCLPPACNGRF